MIHRFLSALFFFFLAFTLYAQAERTIDKNGDGQADTWIEAEAADIQCIRVDTNFDGEIDYLSRTDRRGEKLYEEIDYNHDGGMDDFYFYTSGILERREIDSNYDGSIDIWIYLDEGVYISKYARDTNFDGVIDLVKDYAKEAGE